MSLVGRWRRRRRQVSRAQHDVSRQRSLRRRMCVLPRWRVSYYLHAGVFQSLEERLASAESARGCYAADTAIPYRRV